MCVRLCVFVRARVCVCVCVYVFVHVCVSVPSFSYVLVCPYRAYDNSRTQDKIQSKLTNVRPKPPISGQMQMYFHLFSKVFVNPALLEADGIGSSCIAVTSDLDGEALERLTLWDVFVHRVLKLLVANTHTCGPL